MDQLLSREERAARNRQLLPGVAAILDEVRQRFPKARLIYGRDDSTGYEVGTAGADQVHAADMVPRKVSK